MTLEMQPLLAHPKARWQFGGMMDYKPTNDIKENPLFSSTIRRKCW